MSGWSFGASWLTVVIGVMVIAATGWLGIAQWRRQRGGALLLGLEAVRFVTVVLIVVTLWRPEKVRPAAPNERPVVAVLADASRSMTTRDVVSEGGVLSRLEWVAQQRAAKVWEALSNRYELVMEEFSPVSTNENEGTDINGALEAVLGRERNLRAVVLLSDGDWNTGQSPVAAATKLQMAQVPVFAVGVGSREYLPDVVLENVAAPAYALLGEQVLVGFKVRSFLPRELKTRVTLRDERGAEVGKDITVPALGQVQDAVVWTPMREGGATVRVSLPVESEELRSDNNEQAAQVAIRKETLHVLVIDSLPRWEYRYLRNALQRDPGVEVKTLLFHPGMKVGGGRDYLDQFPATREELSKFDVVFIGDVGIGQNELTKENCLELQGLVEQQGSGLVFLPGSRGRVATLADTALGGMMPVELDEAQSRGVGASAPARLALTARGQGHLLTMLAANEQENASVWRQLPGFYWHAAVKKARSGAEVLAVHEGVRNEWGRMPLLVTRPQGNGKVLFMGTDGAWRWRRGVEDVYHYRFWGQVVRWMSYQRHLAHDQGIRVFYNPDNPQRGERVTLHATVFEASGLPLRAGRVTAEMTAPGGKVERVELAAVGGGWGVFEGTFVPEEKGQFRVRVRSEATNRQIETALDVRGEVREHVGRPAPVEVLREIAAITRGQFGAIGDLAEFVERITQLPERAPVEQRLRLWCHPLWGGGLVFLLAAYWVGRKWVGLI